MRTPCSILVIMAFLINTLGSWPAQASELILPKPGEMVALSPVFAPAVLQGIKVNPNNPLSLEFILNQGEEKVPATLLTEEANKLVKYFMASLTVPEGDLWVNLSPYEKDRIIPEAFGQTDMGRDLLAQDYLLKQVTASLIYPEDELGKKFWKRVYEQAAAQFGTTSIPVNTFNKVWIVPEKAVVYENAKAGTAYVVESKLKVMLEQDYLAMNKQEREAGPAAAAPASVASQVIQEIVIPALTKEVNEGKNFAQLRQVYQSLILAAWYKKKIKDSILSEVYSDQSKVEGITIDDPNDKQKIYEQYLQAFKKGVFNYIKDTDTPNGVSGQMIPRKYFSGGMTMTFSDKSLAMTSDSGLIKKITAVGMMMVAVSLFDASANAAYARPTVQAQAQSNEAMTVVELKKQLGDSQAERFLRFIGTDSFDRIRSVAKKRVQESTDRITLTLKSGKTVIFFRKDYSKKEYSILEDLSLKGIYVPVDTFTFGATKHIVSLLTPGQSMDTYKSFTMRQMVDIASALGRALAEWHIAGYIHGDLGVKYFGYTKARDYYISANHVFLSRADGAYKVLLIDAGLSTRASREKIMKERGNVIQGLIEFFMYDAISPLNTKNARGSWDDGGDSEREKMLRIEESFESGYDGVENVDNAQLSPVDKKFMSFLKSAKLGFKWEYFGFGRAFENTAYLTINGKRYEAYQPSMSEKEWVFMVNDYVIRVGLDADNLQDQRDTFKDIAKKNLGPAFVGYGLIEGAAGYNVVRRIDGKDFGEYKRLTMKQKQAIKVLVKGLVDRKTVVIDFIPENVVWDAVNERAVLIDVGLAEWAPDSKKIDLLGEYLEDFRRGSWSHKSEDLVNVISELEEDFAMNSELGGIDLNPTDKALQIKSEEGAIRFNVDPAMREKLRNAQGFIPVIINILPLTDLPAFMGIS